MARFTDRFLQSLKPKEKSYQERDAKGFAIRVLPSGVKTFLFIWEHDGKRKQQNLGNYPATSLAEARRSYEYARNALVRGEPLTPPAPAPPPIEEKADNVITVRKLQEEYLKYCKDAGQTDEWRYGKESTMNLHLKPWRDRDITTITKADVTALLRGIQAKGGAGRTPYKIFSAMFGYAVDREWLTATPFFRIGKVVPNLGETHKDRALSETEIRHIWTAIDEGPGAADVKRILKLILVTAQRPGEVMKMHSTEIDGDWWTLPPEKAKKGKRYHRVYLTPLAKKLIGELKEGYVFPSARTYLGKHITKITVSQAVNVAKSYGLEKWTPHDLRRTARTHMARIRVPEEHAEAVMNHAKKGMIKVYNQFGYDDEKKEALLKWEAELLRIVEQEDEEVLGREALSNSRFFDRLCNTLSGIEG